MTGEAQRRLHLSLLMYLVFDRMCRANRKGKILWSAMTLSVRTNGTPVRIHSCMENVQMKYMCVVAEINTTTRQMVSYKSTIWLTLPVATTLCRKATGIRENHRMKQCYAQETSCTHSIAVLQMAPKPPVLSARCPCRICNLATSLSIIDFLVFCG